MRCPDCSKFVSYGEPEIEVTDEDAQITDPLTLTAEVRIVLPCGECGTELKEANLSVEARVATDQDGVRVDFREGDEVEEVSVEAEPDEKGEGQGRYRKTFYGARLRFIVTIKRGLGWKDTSLEDGTDTYVFEEEVFEQASYFEELV